MGLTVTAGRRLPTACLEQITHGQHPTPAPLETQQPEFPDTPGNGSPPSTIPEESAMPTSSTTAAGGPAAGAGINVTDAAQRIRELNEQILTAAQQAGGEALDAYEKALQSLVDFEQKAAGATQLDWVAPAAFCSKSTRLCSAFS